MLAEQKGLAGLGLTRARPRCAVLDQNNRATLRQPARTSTLATASRERERGALITMSDEDAPEGGWAPPPWKRKVSNPIKALKSGQRLQGKVRNVEDFGAFIDVGAERDGFVHISEISTEFVYSPHDVLRPGKVEP